jgi:hypothetical protein
VKDNIHSISLTLAVGNRSQNVKKRHQISKSIFSFGDGMLIMITFSIERNMNMNNEFKQFREITENRNGSVVAHSDMIASFKYWYNSSFCPCSRKILLGHAQVKYMPKIAIKILEQPFMIKPGISSSPTDLEGFNLLMALQTSASELGARDQNSEDCERAGKST